MKTKNSRLAFAALLCLLVAPASAAIIHVPVDQPTIQQAINVAANGDLVLVSPGTYFEHIDYHGKAITVQSVAGPVTTIIDGSYNGTVVTFQTQETTQSVLTGFTIQHGANDFYGSGIKLFMASPTITGNVFRNNAQADGYWGAAIGGDLSSAIVEGNTFVANYCDSQFSSGVVSFLFDSSPVVVNNVFARNPCRAINMDSNHPVVANNTIVQNGGGVLVNGANSQLYANNILIGNTVGLEMINPPAPTWINNLVFGNGTNYSGIADQTGMNGNISVDPMFLPTRSREDFELQMGSPAIDAGTLSVPGLPPIDFLGNPRVVDGDCDSDPLPDIGAYEFQPNCIPQDSRVRPTRPGGATNEVTWR